MDQQIPIIDLRPHDQFIQGHLAGAVHIPFSQLNDLWHELPPKGAKLIICLDQSVRQETLTLLEKRQFEIQQIYTTDDLKKLPKVSSSGHKNNRVWTGNPIVENHAELLAPQQSNAKALDIGCGSGRDSMLLGLMGYHVYAIDNFDQALERVKHSAKRWQVDANLVQMDCRQHPEELVALIEATQPQLIMQSRFLHRPLFDIYQEHLPTGCKIVIHTFLEGAAKFGKPKKADFLLKNNELAERFEDWSVLLNQVHHLEDGRPLSMFVAQKT